MKVRILAALLALSTALVAGCKQDSTPGDNATPPPVSHVASPAESPASKSTDLATLEKPDAEHIVLETKRGKIVIELFPNAAPHHVQRFKELANKKYYDGLLFHRVIPGFMIQFGDPNTRKPNRSAWGQGGDDYPPLKAEFNAIPHTPGIVSAARTQDPDSASTQFFICVGTPSQLDGQYTVFGRVIEGQDIANAIVMVPRDESGAQGAQDAPLKDEAVLHATVVPAGPAASPAASPSAEAASPSPGTTK